MSFNHYFDVPIPAGYRIFYHEIDISGVSFRLKSIKKSFVGDEVSLAIDPEPQNKHDENALKIIAIKNGWFGRKRYHHIGYVPREIAKDIALKKYEKLLPRLKELWLGDRGGMKIVIDIVGQKADFVK